LPAWSCSFRPLDAKNDWLVSH